MNIALIGSGGREHALCQKLLESRKIKKIYCIPGNGGTSDIAINLNIDFLNFNLLYKNIKKFKIDLVIVGPEQPLVLGIVDYLKKRKVKVFGPNKYASQLEGSKSFMKALCKRNKIPTANYAVCKKLTDVHKFLKKNRLPLVVKADGLAAGKGVSICKSKNAVINISKKIFSGKFKSSKKLILEEFLLGEEVSYFVAADKSHFSFLGSAQDHKKVGVNEKGPNTGGMGAYSPAPILTKELEKKIVDKIIRPTLIDLRKRKKEFTGFLYAGLMIKENNPYLIEYNVRMGDPECQVIMPRLKTKLIEIINSVVHNKIKNIKIAWNKKKCMAVVLCAKGYPGRYKKFKLIRNLKNINLDNDSRIFHAGTIKKKKEFFSTGGRVLNITSTGNQLLSVRKKIHKIIKKINWKHGFYRSDIGWRVI